jgi:hypothetical protein
MVDPDFNCLSALNATQTIQQLKDPNEFEFKPIECLFSIQMKIRIDTLSLLLALAATPAYAADPDVDAMIMRRVTQPMTKSAGSENFATPRETTYLSHHRALKHSTPKKRKNLNLEEHSRVTHPG